MKIATISAALLIATTSTVALANGNSEAAKAMVGAIKANGASIAPTVSGQNATKGNSGWGNAGSAAFGDQVSKSGRK